MSTTFIYSRNLERMSYLEERAINILCVQLLLDWFLPKMCAKTRELKNFLSFLSHMLQIPRCIDCPVLKADNFPRSWRHFDWQGKESATPRQ